MSQSVHTEVDMISDSKIQHLTRASLFAAIVAVFAYVAAPWPLSPGVPVTLQVLGVFLAGIYLGPVWGAASLTLYLSAGAIGAPVFSGGTAGIGILLGGSPTAGFLWSYPIAAGLTGLIVHNGFTLRKIESIRVWQLIAGMVAGTIVIYSFGTFGFALILDASLQTALVAAALPFIPAEIFKMAAAIGVVRSDLLTPQ